MKPRTWLYGLTADEWLHLACEAEDSEVAPCCANISALRESLQMLATCQGRDNPWRSVYSQHVEESYDMCVETHETLADEEVFPLLNRVINSIREKETTTIKPD